MSEGIPKVSAAASRRQFTLGSLAALVAGPALVQIPAVRRSYAFSGRASSTLWRPFDFWRRNQIFLTGTFNGRRTEMLLDSGAESSVVDLSLAGEVGLTPDAPVDVGGLSDHVSGHGMSFRESAIDLDGLVLSTNRIAILDLSPFSGRWADRCP